MWTSTTGPAPGWRRIEADLDNLTESGRAQIAEAITVIRKTGKWSPLACLASAHPPPGSGEHTMTEAATRGTLSALAKARQRDVDHRQQRVRQALAD